MRSCCGGLTVTSLAVLGSRRPTAMTTSMRASWCTRSTALPAQWSSRVARCCVTACSRSSCGSRLPSTQAFTTSLAGASWTLPTSRASPRMTSTRSTPLASSSLTASASTCCGPSRSMWRCATRAALPLPSSSSSSTGTGRLRRSSTPLWLALLSSALVRWPRPWTVQQVARRRHGSTMSLTVRAEGCSSGLPTMWATRASCLACRCSRPS